NPLLLRESTKGPNCLNEGMNPEEIKKEKVEVDSSSEESCDGFGTTTGTMTQPESKTTSSLHPSDLTGPVNTWRKQVAAVTPP
ncbi:hypothetical protein Ocin01_10257, partial [Orchesella cincta]